jgi:sorting nexin-29
MEHILITSVGFRQGDPLSCLLYNLAIEKVIKHSEIESKGTVYKKGAQILSHTDNIVRVARSMYVLKETVKKLMKAEWVMGLTVNMQKTKHMEVTKQPTSTEMSKIVGQEYERAK